MRRSQFALLVSLPWAVSLGCTPYFQLTLPLPAAIGMTLLSGAASAGLAYLAGYWMDRRSQRQLKGVAVAVGITPGTKDALSAEAITSSLARRLDRMAPFKAAFAELERPALIATAQGEIIASSAGLRALEPGAADGHTVDVVFGTGFLAGGGGVADETLVTLAGRPFEAFRRNAGGGRMLIELRPVGQIVTDDDLEAFTTAVAGGLTGFRFQPEAVEGSAALRALTLALETLDSADEVIGHILNGETPDAGSLGGNSGLTPKLRRLVDGFDRFTDKMAEEAMLRDSLEGKLSAIARAIDAYRASVATIAELADDSRASLSDAEAAFATGRDRTRVAEDLEILVKALAVDAAHAARRTHMAAEGVENASGEIDRMMSTIEDVSVRTNLLALNATVEAGRAGERGAGFAVVAAEVQALAQSTTRTAHEIRTLVGHSRVQASVGRNEAGNLQRIIEGLDLHLHNLSEETDRIAKALDTGSGALNQLDRGTCAVGEAAERALLVSSPHARASAGYTGAAKMRPAVGTH